MSASIFKDGKNGGMMENWGYAAAAWAANLIPKNSRFFWHRFFPRLPTALHLAMCWLYAAVAAHAAAAAASVYLD